MSETHKTISTTQSVARSLDAERRALPDPSPFRWFLRDVLVPLVATRVALTLVGVIALTIFPMRHKPTEVDVSKHQWLNVWCRWDAGWYVSVANEGYHLQEGKHSNIAFSPFYPLLIRSIRWAVPGRPYESWFLAGFIVSNAALVVAMTYLLLLVRNDYGHEVASRTVLYVLVYPTSLFLSAVYAESTFLALAIPAFYYARRGKWWLVGILGFCTSISRPHGMLIAVPLALEYLSQRQFRFRDFRADVLWIALIPLGMATLLVYFYFHLGDPFAPMKMQAAWNRKLMLPWETFRHFFSHSFVAHGAEGGDYSPLDFVFTVLSFVLAVISWRVLRPSYALYNTIFFLMMTITGRLSTNIRYGLALFPAFIVLALAGRSKSFDSAYVSISATLGGLFMAIYALVYWLA